MNLIFKQLIIPEELTGYRLDQALAMLCPEFSRAHIQQWIRNGEVSVNAKPITRPSSKVQSQQAIEINAEPQQQQNWSAQSIDLDIIYEDADLIVVNKPAGLVVHPGAGNIDHTLVNALLHYDQNLKQVPRAGLIHRLDKDTSGLLVIARNITSHCHLVQALQNRDIQRIYQTIVQGVLISGGTVEAPIGRHSRQRTKMSVANGGKPAVTHYRIIQRFNKYTHLQVQLETGRTHQIRVHMAHIRHPVLGDPLYGKKQLPADKLDTPLYQTLQQFNRQALHASNLQLHHPRTQELMNWNAPLPEDMLNLLAVLAEDSKKL